MNYEFFYGAEGLLFSFYRVPKALVWDESFDGLSFQSKFLYGLLLDRMELSVKNNWRDEKGRVFIVYTIEEMCEATRFSDKTVLKMLDELENVGLIMRRHQGLGKPNLIYVKNFISRTENLRVRSRTNYDAGIEDYSFQESEIVRGNDTKKINTDISDTNRILSEGLAEREAVLSYIRERISYEHLKEQNPMDVKAIDEIVELMADVITSQKKTIRIGKEEKPADVVKSRFMKLESGHIDYVLMCLNKNTTKVSNIRAYMLSSLYNAPVMMDHYYRAWVNNDMAQGII